MTATAAKVASALADMRDEYLRPGGTPWIIATSWGKDSTLQTHLAVEMLLGLPPSERRRRIHVVSNDTLVESPLVASHAATRQAELAEAMEAMNLPVTVATTEPDPDRTYWVNVIGRGYALPNRRFRWCTDRLKIEPTSDYVRRQVDKDGEVILLIGVRRSESTARRRSVASHDNGERLNPHGTLRNCMVYRPIVDFDADEVWEHLITTPPPWGSSHRDLVALYRDAGGGECIAVTSKDDAPSCGTTSPRFGCWTCSLVNKDRSLGGFVASGHAHLEPLLDFRDWLVSIRDDPNRRQARRRNNQVKFMADGRLVPGPFTLAARQEILDRLREVEGATGRRLLRDAEEQAIRRIWCEDIMSAAAANRSDRHGADGPALANVAGNRP